MSHDNRRLSWSMLRSRRWGECDVGGQAMTNTFIQRYLCATLCISILGFGDCKGSSPNNTIIIINRRRCERAEAVAGNRQELELADADNKCKHDIRHNVGTVELTWSRATMRVKSRRQERGADAQTSPFRKMLLARRSSLVAMHTLTGDSLCEIRATVRLGDARLTGSRHVARPGRCRCQAGRGHFRVDVVINNTGIIERYNHIANSDPDK